MIKVKKMKGNRWDDHYTRRARQEKWLARSVYKLQEIDQKFKIIHAGNRLLDLGCYPGSWSQYGLKKIGAKGEMVGIDLSKPDRLSSPNFRFIQGDILTLDLEWLSREIGSMDLVMSDLAPKTSGIKSTDASRSILLARRALEISLAVLKTNGHFLCKVLEGEDMGSFKSDVSAHFLKVRPFRPKATRKKSSEVFVLGFQFHK